VCYNQFVTFQITRVSPLKASLVQSLTLAGYISLAGMFMYHANAWVGPINSWLGPILILTFFSASVLICGLASLAYPVWLIWDQKKVTEAIQVLLYTLLWLTLFFVLILLALPRL